MTRERPRVLSIAVAYRKLGYVCLIDGELKDWYCSQEAALSPTLGRSVLRLAIARLAPDLVVSEDPYFPSRKSGQSRDVLYSIAVELRDSTTPHRLVRRHQRYANKYEEAEALAERFPIIAPFLPKAPRIWQAEPGETIYFDALAMAVDVMDSDNSGPHGENA